MHANRREFLTAMLGASALPVVGTGADSRALLHFVSHAELASDPRRPQYHLLPPANWMNDPNAPIYWNGSYHMFYQYNPNAAIWGDMHWGHAVSPDMVHWHHLPVALAPTPGGPDAEGCFTGTAAVEDGRVVILYTGVRKASPEEATIKDATPPLRESQCLATASDPDLKSWIKTPAPVIAAPPELQVNGFRDPSPWRQGDAWYLAAACGIPDAGGAVLLYRSTQPNDLRNWEYMHMLSRRDRAGDAAFNPFDPWEVWECPEFFALGDWHVLIFSTAGKTCWQSGKLDEKTMDFHVEHAGTVDYGSFYAAKTQFDKSGNRILWGWIPESRPVAEYSAAGWAGMMSLPRVLLVDGAGRLRLEFASEIVQLRGRQQSLNVTADESSIQRQIESMRLPACCGEIRCTARSGAGPFELNLAGEDADEAAWMVIEYDPRHANQISVDGRPLSLSLSEGEPLQLHAYVDGSVIELLVNNTIAWTKRFYPAGKIAHDLRIRWRGSSAALTSLDVWQLSPISNDRLTT